MKSGGHRYNSTSISRKSNHDLTRASGSKNTRKINNCVKVNTNRLVTIHLGRISTSLI